MLPVRFIDLTTLKLISTLRKNAGATMYFHLQNMTTDS